MTTQNPPRSSLSITTKKRTYSLPKTQPTRSSSTSNHPISNISHPNKQQIDTCPELAQFKLPAEDLIYTHRMDIDYGRIEEPPSSWEKRYRNCRFDDRYQVINQCEKYLGRMHKDKHATALALMKIADINNSQPLPTNPKNIPSLPKNPSIPTNKSSHQKLPTTTTPRINTSQKKQKQNQQPQQPTNSSNRNYPKSTTKIGTSSRFKFNSYLLEQQNPKYRETVIKNLQWQQSTINKNNSQLSTQRIQHSKDSLPDREITQRRHPHCRIVKSYVGGSKMQIKIINYPDSSQYMKICGLMN